MGFSLGALASFVGSVASNVGNTVLGAYYNRKAASKSQDYAYSMTDYVNDYNTPANQMLRLKEAGLNPNLVYASGVHNTSSGNQGATVSPYRPTLFDYLSAEQMAEQVESQRIQNKIARKDLKVYDDTGIRPGTSPYSDVARILADPEVVKKIMSGGKQLVNYIFDAGKEELSNITKDVKGKPGKGLWFNDSKGSYTFDKDGNRINL